MRVTPKKHTGHISCATTLAMLQIQPDKIDIHMGWRSDAMQKYYIKDFILTDPSGPAARLAQIVKSGNLGIIQQHMIDPTEREKPVCFNLFAEKR